MIRYLGIGYGIALIALGLVGYFATGRASLTALIPSAFGLLICLCGFLALKENLRKHAMHVAVLLSVVAMGGAGYRVFKSGVLTGGEAEFSAAAVIAQSVMVLLSLVFLLFAGKSFYDARRNKE